jgi:hypothetical protein
VGVALTTFIQLALIILSEHELIDNQQFYNFWVDSPISIVYLVIIGLLMIVSVVFSKLLRLNSFLVAFLFIFSFSFVNAMVFIFAKETPSDFRIDLL